MEVIEVDGRATTHVLAVVLQYDLLLENGLLIPVQMREKEQPRQQALSISIEMSMEVLIAEIEEP